MLLFKIASDPKDMIEIGEKKIYEFIRKLGLSKTKAKNVFNINSSTPLTTGIEKMAKWAQKTGIQKSNTFENIEITDKLPKIWLED